MWLNDNALNFECFHDQCTVSSWSVFMTSKSIAQVLKSIANIYTKPIVTYDAYLYHNSKVSPFRILKLQNELQRQDTAS